ncbi:MAG: AAA family ATPase [Mycoplasmataceae bacterium]|nr:AAA family ATPase [Mycoplasmataceae bacterium]
MSKNIAIIGPVGVGKTTLINKLKKEFSNNKFFYFIPEEEKYVFLEKQYSDREKWSYLAQIDFLVTRTKTLFKFNKNSQTINIYDRLFLDDYLYFKFNQENNFLTSDEAENYSFLFEKFLKIFISEKIKIDLIIILNNTNEELKSRRKKRNRFIEDELNEEFILIQDLYRSNWFKEFLEQNSKFFQSKIIWFNNYDIEKDYYEIKNNLYSHYHSLK